MQDQNEKHNINNISTQPASPSPAMSVVKRTAGRLTTLVQALILLSVFSVGLLAGCQFGGGSSATATPQAASTIGGGSLDDVREQVINRVRPSVVQINVALQQGAGMGSGVVIDNRGYIITNNHVVSGGRQIQVMFANGSTLPAQVVGTAPSDDLAVVKVDASKTRLVVATFGDSAKLRVGQEVLAIGNPLGITQTVTNGIVSALDRNVRTGNDGQILPGTIQTDAPINPGNSGGALVDLQGNLIGIPTLAAIDPQFNTPANGVGFAIPSNRAKFIATQLIASGKVTSTGRAALGLQGADVDAAIAAQNNLPVDHGVLIVGLTSNGPAAKAGLRAGDIIVQIGNQAVNDTVALSDALLNKKPGDKVAVGVYRGNQQLTVNATLGELAPQ
ncbi:MAG TPA: trypsin-like peptidase domain-containing protein [Ktedonobacteraceae bacterium]|nr:trypsin-like peptidase domain-containing protein [Ktedonobacteraceae bacterium]